MKAYAVYGPPGTGKTTELLRRVEIAAETFRRNRIGFLSFTKAGAGEALKRLGVTRSDVICTIHSLMFRLTNCSSPSVVDYRKLRQFGEAAGYQFRGQATDTGEQMELGDQYLSILQKAENMLVRRLDEAYYDSDRPGDLAGFKHFAKSYRSWKDSYGFVDFNDMLARYLDNPVPAPIDILFVDEAQDLSDLQWRVLDTLVSVTPGLVEMTIAGDDDQAIYEWAGANTHGMLEFEERYGAERTVLSQSWRVPVSVHAVAVNIASTIETRVEKTYGPRPGDVGRVLRSGVFDPKSIKHGEDILILARSYVTRKEIEDELIRFRIPYRNEGGYPGLFASKVAEAIRVFNKLRNGEGISQIEIDKMVGVADDRTRRDIERKDYRAILSRGFIRSFTIPPQLVDFYREADLSAEPSIRLSTIHSAKGREADRVILHTGLTAKTVRDMDRDEGHADAEARVWYVGVTRAKSTLEILEGDNAYPI